MKNFFTPILLGLCLSGVLADLPYHDFEGRDANIDAPPLSQSTHHYPMSAETGSHHHSHPHHHHSPTGSDPPEQTRQHKYELQQEHPSHHNPYPTSYPTGGYPSHHHHPPPHHSGGHHETPPYPTETKPYPENFAKDEHACTMKTVTRSSGLLPHGTGNPYPYSYPSPRKV